MNGIFPNGEVDHIDHVKTNNVWTNLRDVSGYENHLNLSMDKRNKTGVTCIKYRKEHNRFIARIGINNTDIYLGSFKDVNDAIMARKNAEIKYGFHKNHGTVKR